jgi:hypothetical protein
MEKVMPEPGFTRLVDPARFPDHPEEMYWQSQTDSFSMPPAELEAIQLRALRRRFEEQREKLPPLRRLADENGLTTISAINDAAALLFKHSVYKSYPVSLIEKNRFDRLTHWLDNLTTEDLSSTQNAGIESIDDWLDMLDRTLGVRVIHTTGTSGKLSFLPRGKADSTRQFRSNRLAQQPLGTAEPVGLQSVPTIVIGHRHAYNGYGAMIDALVADLYAGDESMVVTMNPGRLSADVMSLAGRLAAAENRGELGRSSLSPAILQRMDEFVEAQKSAPERRARFFDTIINRFAGKRVMMSGNWAMYQEMMAAGHARGISGLFAEDSLMICAGGTKGATLPEGYREAIPRFLGLPVLHELYGMSEMSALMPKCAAGNYHAWPWMVLFLLDPETGDPAPRTGSHTGRFGVIDLSCETRWGGVVSGDEVTMTFGKCECGLEGTFIADSVRRYTDKEGGDDKITCAGAPAAHDNALAFLASVE